MPKHYDVFNIKIRKPSQTHFLLQNRIHDPIFFHRMEVQPHLSVEEMARGIVKYCKFISAFHYLSTYRYLGIRAGGKCKLILKNRVHIPTKNNWEAQYIGVRIPSHLCQPTHISGCLGVPLGVNWTMGKHKSAYWHATCIQVHKTHNIYIYITCVFPSSKCRETASFRVRDNRSYHHMDSRIPRTPWRAPNMPCVVVNFRVVSPWLSEPSS